MEEEGQLRLRIRRSDTRSLHWAPVRGEKIQENGNLKNIFGYAILFVILIILKFFYYYENFMPRQLCLNDASSNPDRFIGQRAELQLRTLTNLGPRVVGSYENEVLAVDFLKREISYITQEAHKNHKIEIDIQRPTGSYLLRFKNDRFRNCYTNIQNVIARLSSKKSSKHSVLMNCHFDTVPESPGASDNGLNCAVLLEILRVLSLSPIELKNNVIFLFNGAEENPLQGSHGFLEHKWSKEVKVVVNLDSAGAGGKEILFQTSGDSWLVKAFAQSVPNPVAGVQAEELFHLGIIPSDTDFRIFRDFGHIPGFDIAHYMNGYVYHTRYDKMDFIDPGVYQFTGDNILGLVKELSRRLDLGVQEANSKTKVVYFDVFELFVVIYTETTGTVINLITVFVSVFSMYKMCDALNEFKVRYVKNLVKSLGGYLVGILLSLIVIILIAVILDFCYATMSWYRRQWLFIPIYAIPIFLTVVGGLLQTLTVMRRNIVHKVIVMLNGVQLLWTLVLLICTLKGLRSSYICMFLVLPVSVGSLALTSRNYNFTVKTYFIVYFCSLVLPILFISLQSIRLLTTMVPITARMGPQQNPEIIMAALVFLFSTPFVTYFAPVFLLLRNVKTFLFSILAVHFLTMGAILGTGFGFPYTGDVDGPALQRFYAMHCARTFYDQKGLVRKSDSGIFVMSTDRNSINYLKKDIPELKEARRASTDCSTELLCGFPVFTSRFIGPAPHSHFISAPPPTIHNPVSMSVVNLTQSSSNVKKYRIVVKGPDHMVVILSPRKNVRLVEWSYKELGTLEDKFQDGRPVYMIFFSHGLLGGFLDFEVHLEISQDINLPVMDLAIVGHYMHDKGFRTEVFKRIISKFPDWTNVAPWTTTFTSWVF